MERVGDGKMTVEARKVLYLLLIFRILLTKSPLVNFRWYTFT